MAPRNSWTAQDSDRFGAGIADVLLEYAPAVFGWALGFSITGVDPAKPRGGRAPDQVAADGRGGLKAVEGGK